MSSFSTTKLCVVSSEPGAEAGDQNWFTDVTGGTGQATETTKNPVATFTEFATLSNMSDAGFLRIRIVDTAGVLVAKARIPLLADE